MSSSAAHPGKLALAASVGMLMAMLGCSHRQSLPLPEMPLARNPETPHSVAPPPVEHGTMLAVPPVHRAVLDNGLSVYVLEQPQWPIVTLALATRVNGADGTAAGSRVAEMTAWLVAEGAHSERPVDNAELGERVDWHPGEAGTSYELTVGTAELDEAVRYLARVVRQPEFAEDVFDRATRRRARVRVQQSWRIDDRLRGLAASDLFGSAELAGALPDDAGVEKPIALSQVRQFYDEHFGPAQSAVVVAGAVDASAVVELVRERFGDWASSARLVPRRTALPSTPVLDPGDMMAQGLVLTGVEPRILVALPCVGASHPDSDVLNVAANLIGRQAFSRGSVELREDRGISYAVDAACTQSANRGLFWVVADSDVGHVGDVLRSLVSKVRDLGNSPVSDVELQAAKASYLARQSEKLSTTAGMTRAIAELWLDDLSMDRYATLEAKVDAIGKNDLQRVARRYLASAPISIAVAGDPKPIVPQLGRLGDLPWHAFSNEAGP